LNNEVICHRSLNQLQSFLMGKNPQFGSYNLGNLPPISIGDLKLSLSGTIVSFSAAGPAIHRWGATISFSFGDGGTDQTTNIPPPPNIDLGVIVSDPTPGPTFPIPTPDPSDPDPTEDTPAPTENTPAPTEDTPAPTEDTPGPTEEEEEEPEEEEDDEDFVEESADLQPNDSLQGVAPGVFNLTFPGDQIVGAPVGMYFSGSFTVTIANDGTPTYSAWNVSLNFAWPNGGVAAVPAP
jgi:hypothetical protein